MKVKEGFVLRDVAGSAMVIAVGEASKSFQGMVRLNDTGKEIWKYVENGMSEEQIVAAMKEKYDVSEDKLKNDVHEMIQRMVKAGFVINE